MKITTNKLMLLIDIYKGSFDEERYFGTYKSDIKELSKLILTDKNDELYLSEDGDTLIENVLKIANKLYERIE